MYLIHKKVGFPLIFHTDNGTEFINEYVYSLLKDMDPNILLVTGAPRTPGHQGSVENVNKTIKNTIDKVIAGERLKGNDSVTWLNVLPEVTSSVNSSVVYGNSKLSPYKYVFTYEYDHHFIFQRRIGSE